MAEPEKIVHKMLENDHFTEWMGLVIDEIRVGYCLLHFTVKKEMLNGFSTIHGGVLFSASDSAFAFACNTHGRLSVALDVSISFTKAAKMGDVLTVEAKEAYLGNKTSVYDIVTKNEMGETIAIFKGTAYRTNVNILNQ